MDDFRPYVGVFWGPRALTFGQFVTQIRRFLHGLAELDPLFGTWYVLGDRMSDEKALGPNLEHLDALALERGWDEKAPKEWYENLDASGNPTSDTVIDVGWGFGLVTEPEAQRTSDFVYASIDVGCTLPNIPNSVLLQVYDPASPFLDPVLSERVFEYMVEFWDPDHGLVTESAYRHAVKGPVQLGWLNYQADPSFTRFLPEGVRHESFGKGVVFRLGDGRVLGENDQAEIKLGLQIQEAILHDS